MNNTNIDKDIDIAIGYAASMIQNMREDRPGAPSNFTATAAAAVEATGLPAVLSYFAAVAGNLLTNYTEQADRESAAADLAERQTC